VANSKREQVVLVASVTIAVAVLSIYIGSIVLPLLQRVSQLDQRIQLTDQQFKTYHLLAKQQPELQREHDELTSSLQQLRSSMPAEQELASVIEQLSGMANQAGLKILTIFPQRSLESFKVVAGLDPASQTRLYKEIPIQVDALSGYHQLGRFLARVERGRQPVQLKVLRVTSSPKEPRRHTVQMVLIAYFATADTRATTAASAKSP
jgi:Tfp pilus assembly protein PilO